MKLVPIGLIKVAMLCSAAPLVSDGDEIASVGTVREARR